MSSTETRDLQHPDQESITVLKIGGRIINDPAGLQAAFDFVARSNEQIVLVHGGGRKADALLQRMGEKPVMIEGRRITDDATLEVVTMVYAGLLNKQIVAGLQSKGVNAIGLSGADGNLIEAQKRPVTTIDYGYAGDITAVNARLLEQLLAQGLCPVLCSITHNRAGQLLNTNADTIANETAQALAQAGHRVRLAYCFELPGVLEDINRPDSVIPVLNPENYASFKAAGVIAAGMIPKLDNAFGALAAGVKEVRIGHLAAIEHGQATRLVAE